MSRGDIGYWLHWTPEARFSRTDAPDPTDKTDKTPSRVDSVSFVSAPPAYILEKRPPPPPVTALRPSGAL